MSISYTLGAHRIPFLLLVVLQFLTLTRYLYENNKKKKNRTFYWTRVERVVAIRFINFYDQELGV